MRELLIDLLGKFSGQRKTRRTAEESEFRKALRQGMLCRTIVLSLFVLGLALLILTGGQEEPLKKFLISLLIFFTAITQLWVNHPQTLASNARLMLVMLVMLLQLTAIKGVLVQAELGRIDLQLAPLLVPYAFAPLVLSVMLGRNQGLYAAVFCSLWGAFLLPRIDPVFLVISLITGFVAVYATIQVRRRGRLIRAGVYVGMVTWILAATFGQIGPIVWESLGSTNWPMIGWQSVAAIGMGIGTAVVVTGLLPALEGVFGLTTDISWLEMADLNHPLLKKMSMEAPGTYHHSLAVANLSEAAAETVGANPTICRVASYFHDIGKLVKPDYFTENMHQGVNPHDELTPTMSALIIIAHVKEGVDLALKHHLNPVIVDIIREHHGTSLVAYFYHRALHHQKDAILGGKIMNLRSEDVQQVNPSSYRYPGPRPKTKESAIVSLADSIESASRSLERPNPQKIDDLIQDLIKDRMDDHQLDKAPLTLDELRRVGESFRFTLQSMLHSRVAYPKKEGKDKSSSGSGNSESGSDPSRVKSA